MIILDRVHFNKYFIVKVKVIQINFDIVGFLRFTYDKLNEIQHYCV